MDKKNNGISAVIASGLLMASLYMNNAVADDDVAALVVDNGTPVSVPEPSTLAMMLGGVIGIGLVARKNRKASKNKEQGE